MKIHWVKLALALPVLVLSTFVLAAPAIARHRDPEPSTVYEQPVKIIYKYVTRPDPPPAPPKDFSEDLLALWAMVKPGASGELDGILAEYKRNWLAVAMPFLAGIVPKDLPRTVVYPFGGGDLVSALAVYPDATDITTISLEPAGEVAAMFRGGPAYTRERLAKVRKDIHFLLSQAFSRTEDMTQQNEEQIPGQVVYSLMALNVHGYEPVSLKYFRFGPGGEVKYWNEPDLKTQINLGNEHVWDNMELRFRAQGEGSPERVHRHIYIDLSDKRFEKDPVLLKFLQSKGRVSAITKACSYLLWENAFSVIRKYLLDQADFIISDATGVPPHVARAAGHEQITYGRFSAAIMKVNQETKDEFVNMWKKQPFRKLPFRFGYPNHGSGEGHLLITRPLKGSDAK